MRKAQLFKTNIFKPRFLMVFLLVVIVGFFFAGVANAGFPTFIATMLGWVIYGIVWALGQILILMMSVLVWVAQFNTFINAKAVTLGWKIVRDICNMFFVVIMLVIAFATVLRVEKYSYEKLLPKLIIMAILINFSKLICGLIIDAAQIVMLTFVNSFKDVAGSNLMNLLGLDNLVSMSENQDAANSTASSTGQDDVSGWSILGAYILALIYVIIALVTIVTMVVMLAVRIVMLWIYVVLSPMAYLLAAFPAGQKYASQWWEDFTRNVIVGPVLAFFIWLSFASLGSGGVDAITGSGVDAGTAKIGGTGGAQSLTKAGSPGNMLNFIISIAMLYGGLQVAQGVGGAAAGIAKKGVGQISKGALFASGAALAFSKRKAISAAKFTGRSAKTGLGAIDRGLGNMVDNTFRKDKDGKFRNPGATAYADKGLFNHTTDYLAALPGKAKVAMKSDKEMNLSLRNFNREADRVGVKDAVLKHDNKKYKFDENDQKFHELDKDNQPTANTLKDRTGKKEITKMSAARESFYDSYRSNFGKANVEANKEQDAKISEKQRDMAESAMSNEEIASILTNSSSSVTEKMAAAMTLAVKSGFKDASQVNAAKNALASNPILSKKFADEVDKNQAHLAYNLENEADIAKFKSRVSYGKIDTTKMQAEAYELPGMIKILQEYHGKDFGRVMQTVYNRGASYEKAVSTGLLANRDTTGDKINSNDQFASIHAKLTGEIQNSFSVNGQIDASAMERHFASRNAGAADLSKISKKYLEDLIAQNNQQVNQNILNGFSYSKLKSMLKQNSNDEVVKYMVDLHIKSNVNSANSKLILGDKDLGSLASPSSILVP